MTDIDIDFYDRDILLSKIPHVIASRIDRGEVKKHNTGVYFQKIPINPLTKLSSIDYETAEQRGYFKIDFLNVNVYKGVRNEKHVNQLLSIEPSWELLYEKDICDQLFHINGYHGLLAKLKPSNITELAMVLALIRPGKKHLIEKCEKDGFNSIKDEIWIKTGGEYFFKKAHALSYAHVIVMQLNLLCEGLTPLIV
jgi:DNA polymerase III alpha subunit